MPTRLTSKSRKYEVHVNPRSLEERMHANGLWGRPFPSVHASMNLHGNPEMPTHVLHSSVPFGQFLLACQSEKNTPASPHTPFPVRIMVPGGRPCRHWDLVQINPPSQFAVVFQSLT